MRTFTELESQLYHTIRKSRALRPSLAANDIDGAFNNTLPSALITIMEQRKMPRYLIGWIKDFTTDRSLSFSFDNRLELPQPFVNALPQGSPVSGVLFLIAMSAIFQETDSKIVSHSEYVDDATEITAGVKIENVIKNLSESFDKKAVRANTLGLQFSRKKSELINFSCRKRRIPIDSIMKLTDSAGSWDVSPSIQIKLLGVIVDDTLNLLLHSQHAPSKAIQILGSLY